METIFFMILQLAVVLAIAPLYDGLSRKLRAKLQSKQGCSIFQTYYDMAKLIKRERTKPACSHWVFEYAPYILFGICASLLLTIPMAFHHNEKIGAYCDIFVIIYLLAMYRFIWGIASLDSGSPFAAVGGSREQMLSVYGEPVIIMCLIVVMLHCGTSNLAVITNLTRTFEVGYFIPSFAIASIAFLWAMYLETGRKPYDLAEAEQEIQEGLLTEYSGKDLVLIQGAMMMKQWAMIGFFLIIFEPWNFNNPFLELIVYVAEVGVFYVGAILIDNFGPRYQITDGARKSGFMALIIAFIALSLYVVGA